jgi:hypothetical protein
MEQTMSQRRSNSIPTVLEGLDAFERWHAKQTHDDGKRISPDKAIVRAIERALQAILIDDRQTVSIDQVQAWLLNDLGFRIDLNRIDEHCLYKAGKTGTATKRFAQPKMNPDLRIVRDHVYAVASGKAFYTYETRSHSRK